MDSRLLGKTGLKVSVLGFGCAPVGSRAGSGESERALKLAFDSGVTFFDTADMYGVGGSEMLLGKVFSGRRDKVVISTKCGYTFSNKLKAVAWVKPLLRPLVKRLKGVKAGAASVMASQRSQNFDPAYIEQCVHGSLERLGTDHVDLFFLHDPSMAVVERGDAFPKLRALQQAGKIRHYGVSCDVDVAVKALQTQGSGISVVEINTNALEQESLRDLLPMCRQAGVGFIARGPFAHGRLFMDPAVAASLKEHGLPTDAGYVSSFALRFLREIDGIASILPSMMKPAHLQANVAALAGGPLTEKERACAAALGRLPKSGGAH